MIDRRLVDLELKGYEEELHRRNATLDIPHADRMRYWLAGWKQSYGVAFDHDEFLRDLNEHQCLDRINDLKGFVADRETSQDPGTAQIYTNWLNVMVGCFELATGRQIEQGEGPIADEEVPPTPKVMAGMAFLARRSKIKKWTGQTPQDGNEARDIYEPWYANWYRAKYGSDPIAA